jgi:hypothetical protein
MNTDRPRFVVMNHRSSTQNEFVDFWSKQYLDKNENLYIRNIGKSLIPDTVRELFHWKNGGTLSIRKTQSVEANFIARLSELTTLSQGCDARSFFDKFSKGGAIWRIFFLHIWQPRTYPIYDQHVHRSMCFLKTGSAQEMPLRAEEVIESYVRTYLRFYEAFDSTPNHRAVDKALWMFGRFLKSPFKGCVV